MKTRYIGFMRTEPTPAFGICLDGVAYTFEVTERGIVATNWGVSGRELTHRAPCLPVEVFYSDAELVADFEAAYTNDEVSGLVGAAMTSLAQA